MTDIDYDFIYDSAGNILTKEEDSVLSVTYTYDTLNRMKSSTPNGGTATSYVYNAADERISKTTGTLTTNSIWENGQIAFDEFIAGGTSYYKQFLQGNGQHGLINDGELTPNFINSKGDAVATISSFTLSGNNMNVGHCDAYGNALAIANNSNPYGYRGYYTDFETEFYYLNARYYDPATQRFTQEDTYWNDNPQMNLYVYCSGNPVMYSDPSGNIFVVSDENGRIVTSGGSTLRDKIAYAKQRKLIMDKFLVSASLDPITKPIHMLTPTPTLKPTPTLVPRPWDIPIDVQEQNEKMIDTLVPELQFKARRFLVEANNKGYALFITWGKRTPEQIAAVGAAEKGKHLYGKAFDVQIWNDVYKELWPCDGDPVRFHKIIYKYAPIRAEKDDSRYKGLNGIGAIGKSVGLRWGGEIFLPVLYDPVHFEIK